MSIDAYAAASMAASLRDELVGRRECLAVYGNKKRVRFHPPVSARLKPLLPR